MREETDWLGSDQFLPDGKFPSDSSKIKPPKGDWEKLRILQSFLRFRGVATKYLNNYNVYNNFVTFAKESFMEKIKILKNEIFTFRVEKRSYSANISKENRYLYSRINTYSEQSQKNIKLCYKHSDPRVINYDYFYKENLCFRDLCLP